MNKRHKKRIIQFAAAVFMLLAIGILAGTVYTRAAEARNEKEAFAQEKPDTFVPDIIREETKKVLLNQALEKEKVEEQQTEEELPDDWNLILVNKTHLLPDDFEVELVEIADGHQMDARIYPEFAAMIRAAKADGVILYVTSSYRDMDKQTDLYEKKVESYVQEGYAYDEAKELASQVVAIPGTSEHHLGLALDFVFPEYKKLDENLENTKPFQWMKEHCAEYGFILRYPSDKTEITGIIYEPWHFRYVGKEAAEEIMNAEITLEEYLGAAPVCAVSNS